MDYKEFYNTNADFRLYVDKHCESSGDSIEEALDKYIIKQVANYYKDQEVVT